LFWKLSSFDYIFTASTGGLLGLFMGFSFLSAVEIGYYIVLRVWCLSLQHKKEIRALNDEKPSHKIKLQPSYPFLQ
jgi:hypothetical protein